MAKAVDFKIVGWKCDAVGCEYKDESTVIESIEEAEKFLKVNCPLCGAPLLTDADFKTMQFIASMADATNVLIGDLQEPEGERVVVKLNMNGTGTVDFE